MKRIARLSLGILLMAAAGCTRWQYTHPLPAPGEAPRTFNAARVTLAAGTTVVLRDVEVTPDSVVGWRGGRHRGLQRVAVHRSQVVVLDRSEPAPLKTAGATLLAVLVAYGTAVVYALLTVTT
jgi:hypothetical protein